MMMMLMMMMMMMSALVSKVHRNANGCRDTNLLAGTLEGDELTRQPKNHSIAAVGSGLKASCGAVLKGDNCIPVSRGYTEANFPRASFPLPTLRARTVAKAGWA